MGFATPYEVWVAPIERDWPTVLGMMAFYFTAQFVFVKCFPKVLPNYHKLSTAEKEDVTVRSVSIANGIVMTGSAALFLCNLYQNNWTFSNDLYETVPHYRFFRLAILGYFCWDVVVCFVFHWSFAWKVHAVCSVIGTYTLAFPFSDGFAGYYTGCFELSNGFLHGSVMLHTLARMCDPVTQKQLIDTLESRAAVCEYIFAALFAVVRVLVGTFVTYSWAKRSLGNVYADYVHRGEPEYQLRTHDELATFFACMTIFIVQILQYVWFGEIVQRALGMVSGKPAEAEKVAAASTKGGEGEKKSK